MSVSPQNLIIFQSDNHARSIMGCAGHPWVKTPNLDGLAARGVLFEAAYTASPLCCPSRAAMATGRFPHETRYWDNALAYDGRVPSWMHRARAHGRKVAAIGKLHYRGGDDYGFSEEIQTMHLHGGKGAVLTLLRGYDAEPARTNSAFYDLYAARSGEGATTYQAYDVEITRQAQGWLRQNTGESAPWVLLVSWVSPHPPFTVPQRFLDLYPVEDMPLPPGWEGNGWASHPAYRHLRHLERLPDRLDPDMLRRVAAAYFGLVSHVDEQLGEVLGTLDELGLRDNTRVMYTSDHGELFGAYGLFGKRVLYEASVGVPLILAGPEVPAGGRRSAPVSQVDLFPTILQGLGVPLEPQDGNLPGRSLWPPTAGREWTDRPVFAEYHAHGSQAGMYMLRQNHHKLIHHVGLPQQLFDLRRDPAELEDLAGQAGAAEVADGLLHELEKICDPAEADALAKADQRRRVEELGGREAVGTADRILYSPPPGVALER